MPIGSPGVLFSSIQRGWMRNKRPWSYWKRLGKGEMELLGNTDSLATHFKWFKWYQTIIYMWFALGSLFHYNKSIGWWNNLYWSGQGWVWWEKRESHFFPQAKLFRREPLLQNPRMTEKPSHRQLYIWISPCLMSTLQQRIKDDCKGDPGAWNSVQSRQGRD